MKFKQYEIWLADLNPRFGTEAGKTRPVLIVQSDILNKIHPSSIICPITPHIKKGVSILRVNLKKETSGLKKESAIMIDQVRAIDNKRLLKKIGELPSSLQNKVVENLKIILDIER
ncbi:MAG: type II toxin-antitoxin system PemK/MazF family toxin [Saprospiraceae bacterium]|nr:type II toxin-antitoxin system PemK/MazF family toxin [Saprospiraceae bacterium]MCB9326883.1 type II toxin-antitoxin system PemK/MazF family toxin [Lewinellaceae bacterium]